MVEVPSDGKYKITVIIDSFENHLVVLHTVATKEIGCHHEIVSTALCFVHDCLKHNN